MDFVSPILGTDSYKFSHWVQYPPKTTKIRSYLESRGGEFNRVVSFGVLQYKMDNLCNRPVTMADIDEAEDILALHFGNRQNFNRAGWELLVNRHGGYFPLKIRAVPEGTVMPTGNALLTVENTDDDFPWLTNYVETRLSQTWYPYTVATLSYHAHKIIESFLHETGTPEDVWFKLHDFGYRGVSSEESAAIGGLAHLVNFMGSDTMPAMLMARRYYQTPMAAFSIPASEHSTITSWLLKNEVDAYRNMLHQYPTGLMACVSDSRNIYEACELLWGGVLRDDVLKRNGTLVIRPDSGHPPTVVLKVLNILWDKFGGTTNQKGYKVLDPHVRIIQGDGVDLDMIQTILEMMRDNGWSADNIAFGMGGALLQKVNRDTQKFAFKCSSAVVDGVERAVYKDPVDDPGKKSKAGDLTVFGDTYNFITADRSMLMATPFKDIMETIYQKDIGMAAPMPMRRQTFQDIRDRVYA